jgi:hypothetical protein
MSLLKERQTGEALELSKEKHCYCGSAGELDGNAVGLLFSAGAPVSSHHSFRW